MELISGARRTDRTDKDATRLLCGSEMVDRTVVVNLRFPHAIGSGEIGTVFVMRTPPGAYRVWYLWHP